MDKAIREIQQVQAQREQDYLVSKATGCPFCGQPPESIVDKGLFNSHHVECTSCGARGPRAQCASDSVGVWNRRLT